MKAKINGIEIEETSQEIKEFIINNSQLNCDALDCQETKSCALLDKSSSDSSPDNFNDLEANRRSMNKNVY